MSRLRLAVLPLLLSGCLQAWPVGGPWKCSSGDTCPNGLTCDDGLCCNPGGAPACPTLPLLSGGCPDGSASVTVYEDRDGDGHGNPQAPRVQCAMPRTGAWVASADDCDDSAAAIHPGAAEQCNGFDDNCDGRPDEGLSPSATYTLDADGDGYGDAAAGSVTACQAPPGYSALAGDCAPDDPTRSPGAPERCNNLDDDCDGQTDELPLSDSDAPGDTAPRFGCATQEPGACARGSWQCRAVPGGSGHQRTCARIQEPAARDVCNGVDDDCDSHVDEAPDCGGPRSLTGADVKLGAFLMTNTTGLYAQCRKGLKTPGSDEAASGGTWDGGAAGYHVWYAEPADGGVWDLSKAKLELRLDWTAAFTPAAGDGMWGSPVNGAAYNPTVYLCGDQDTEMMRYRVAASGDAFAGNDTTFTLPLPLNVANGSAWLVGRGSGFDTTRVRRVELVVQSFAPGWTITFSPSTGFWSP